MKIKWSSIKFLVNEIFENAANPRKISRESGNQLRRSIEKFGLCEPIAVNQNGLIIGGHQRFRLLQSMGQYEIDCFVPDRLLSNEEVQELTIRLNKNGGEWDFDILANEWDTNELINWGFTEKELELFEAEKIPGKDDGFDEELPSQPKTKPGDIYQLGNHRLICGSATDHGVVEKILDSELIDLVITDPPYNVAYIGIRKDKLSIENDNLSDEQFSLFLKDFYMNAYTFMKSGAGIYVFHADCEGEKFRRFFKESSLKLSQCLIWVKNHFSIGTNDYHWQHEPVLYGWKEGEAHEWYSDRKQTTLLKFDKPTRNAEHPTMKPIDLICYLINNSSKKGQLVFDFFLGSGSTLIASEQTGRKCYGCELDPKYCDVIVERYKKYKIQNNQPCEIKLNGEIYNG